jgi:hypothetical protein
MSVIRLPIELFSQTDHFNQVHGDPLKGRMGTASKMRFVYDITMIAVSALATALTLPNTLSWAWVMLASSVLLQAVRLRGTCLTGGDMRRSTTAHRRGRTADWTTLCDNWTYTQSVGRVEAS